MKIATIVAQVLVGAGVRGVWIESVFAFFAGDIATWIGRTVSVDFVRVEVRAFCGSGTGDRRGAVDDKPLCSAGADTAGGGAVQYFVVSRAAEPCRMAAGSGDGDSLDFSFFPVQEELCGNFCGEGGVSEVQRQTGRRVLMRHAPFRSWGMNQRSFSSAWSLPNSEV